MSHELSNIVSSQDSTPPSQARPQLLGKPHPKGYRVKVGSKRFWLGRDPINAQQLLSFINLEWEAVQKRAITPPARGQSLVWPDDAVLRVLDKKAELQRRTTNPNTHPQRSALDGHQIAGESRISAASCQPSSRRVPQSSVTKPAQLVLLSTAIDQYIAKRREDLNAGQIQASRLSLIRYSLGRLFWVLQDLPLAAISTDDVRRGINFFLSRPVSTTTGKALSPSTVIETIYFMRKFWEHLIDRGEWATSIPVDKLFNYRRQKLYSDSEREAQSTVTVYTLAELEIIWRVAGDDSRERPRRAARQSDTKSPSTPSRRRHVGKCHFRHQWHLDSLHVGIRHPWWYSRRTAT